MNEHLAALQAWVAKEGLDLAYISDPININYYTGFFFKILRNASQR